jgi:hypothetical protein
MLHPILERVEAIGGRVFSQGDYNLNIVGIRNPNPRPNKFDDVMHVIYKAADQWVDRWWPITTDPGTYYLENPMNDLGTAAVVADRQYRGVWTIGLHRGSYQALVQTGAKIAVYRDDNCDDKVDYDPNNIEEGWFGINCHRATASEFGSVDVDRWSAGCQVFSSPHDFDAFLSICKKQRDLRGWDSFTYTLLTGGW